MDTVLSFDCDGSELGINGVFFNRRDLTLFINQWKCSNLKEEIEYIRGVNWQNNILEKARKDRAHSRGFGVEVDLFANIGKVQKNGCSFSGW